jgi:hypothetical protein
MARLPMRANGHWRESKPLLAVRTHPPVSNLPPVVAEENFAAGATEMKNLSFLRLPAMKEQKDAHARQ